MTCTTWRNAERGDLWVRFPAPPPKELREQLSRKGARWSAEQKAWRLHAGTDQEGALELLRQGSEASNPSSDEVSLPAELWRATLEGVRAIAETIGVDWQGIADAERPEDVVPMVLIACREALRPTTEGKSWEYLRDVERAAVERYSRTKAGGKLDDEEVEAARDLSQPVFLPDGTRWQRFPTWKPGKGQTPAQWTQEIASLTNGRHYLDLLEASRLVKGGNRRYLYRARERLVDWLRTPPHRRESQYPLGEQDQKRIAKWAEARNRAKTRRDHGQYGLKIAKADLAAG